MGKRAIFINNIPVYNAHIVELTENTIVCNSIREDFFGISTILLENKEIICEHQDSIVKCSVRVDDKIYENIPFNLIIDKDAKSKVAINKNTLINPSFFTEAKKHVEEVIEETFIEPDVKEDNSKILELVRKRENKLNSLNKELSQLKNQKAIQEQRVEEFIQRKIEKGIEGYKQKLYNDFFIITEEQSELKQAVIKETVDKLKETFDEKYIELVSEIKQVSAEEIESSVKSFVQDLEQTLTLNQKLNISELKSLIESTIKEDLLVVTDEVKNKLKIQVNENVENINNKLESYKQLIKNDLTELFEKDNSLLKESIKEDFYANILTVRDEIRGEWPEKEEAIKDSIESVKNIIEKKESDLNKAILSLKDDIISSYIKDLYSNKKEIKEEIQVYLEDLNRKIDSKKTEQVVLESNDLVLQATKSLIEEDSRTSNKLRKFKDQLIKDLQKAAEQYTQEANRRMMRYAEMMSGGGSTAQQLANGGTINGSLDILGEILSGGKNLSEIFAISGSGGGGAGREDVNTAVITYSANWNTAYSYVSSQSLNTLDNVQFNSVLSNSLSVLGDTKITNNLTVQGNISALGTATFANTIFTTTSALSVVNTGPGPALYVYQASGPYDVASFYDGDGIEVLHVGNAGPGGLGKVGVNESFPNEELTVRGSISATETIYANNYLSAGVNLLQILGPTERQFDYAVQDETSYNYCGTAPFGSLTSSSTWTIKRLLFTSAGTLLSSGIVYNSIWDNRYSYSY